MKSNKQRRAEIREKRIKKIKDQLKVLPLVIYAHLEKLAGLDRTNIVVPIGAAAVNSRALVTHSTLISCPRLLSRQALSLYTMWRRANLDGQGTKMVV